MTKDGEVQEGNNTYIEHEVPDGAISRRLTRAWKKAIEIGDGEVAQAAADAMGVPVDVDPNGVVIKRKPSE